MPIPVDTEIFSSRKFSSFTSYQHGNEMTVIIGTDKSTYRLDKVDVRGAVLRITSSARFGTQKPSVGWIVVMPGSKYASPIYNTRKSARQAVAEPVRVEPEEDFEVVCANGCPQGAQGIHKFSCELAGQIGIVQAPKKTPPTRITAWYCSGCGQMSNRKFGTHFIPKSNGTSCHGKITTVIYERQNMTEEPTTSLDTTRERQEDERETRAMHHVYGTHS